MFSNLLLHVLSISSSWDEKHHISETSTDDTDEDRATGGYGKYSHQHTALSHQHWRQQLVHAGTFDLNCTEGAEAYHKSCLSLPSSRVRHLGDSVTKKNMLNYLLNNQVFEQIRKVHFPPVLTSTRRVTFCDRVNVPLRRWIGDRAANVTMGDDLSSAESQSQFLHDEVRLAKFEILDLVCKRVGLRTTRHSYNLLGRLKWTFGQKLTTSTGDTFWSTDTRFQTCCNTRFQTCCNTRFETCCNTRFQTCCSTRFQTYCNTRVR